MKPPTFKKVACQRLDEYALNGFQTLDEPLQVLRPQDATGFYQLRFSKGAARTHALNATLLHLSLLKKSVHATAPTLAHSLFTIHCIAPLVDPTMEQIAFRSAQLGSRGSIRKPLDIFLWVIAFKKINASSEQDGKRAISEWNEKFATRDATLAGQKRAAVLSLLTAPDECVPMMLDQIARFGVDGAVCTDESFASKKLCSLAIAGKCFNCQCGRNFLSSLTRVSTSCALS